MIAGNATPSDARMMWKPSVNAIWLRAAVSCEANWSALTIGSLTRRADSETRSSSQSMRAASERSSTIGPRVLENAVPAPVEEALDPVAHSRHQRRVDAEPGGVGDRAVQLVAVRADLGDRGAAPDHGHDALVVVVERLARLAGEVGEQVVGGPDPALLSHRAELGQVVAVRARDVGDVADRVHARRTVHGEIRQYVHPAAGALREADRGRLDAASPDDAPGRDRLPSDSVT